MIVESIAKQIKVTGTNRAGDLVFAAIAIPPQLKTDGRTSGYLAARARVITRFRKRHPNAKVQRVSITQYRVTAEPYRKEAPDWEACVLVNGFLPKREPVWASVTVEKNPPDDVLLEKCAQALAEFRDRYPHATDITLKAKVRNP